MVLPWSSITSKELAGPLYKQYHNRPLPCSPVLIRSAANWDSVEEQEEVQILHHVSGRRHG